MTDFIYQNLINDINMKDLKIKELRNIIEFKNHEIDAVLNALREEKSKSNPYNINDKSEIIDVSYLRDNITLAIQSSVTIENDFRKNGHHIIARIYENNNTRGFGYFISKDIIEDISKETKITIINNLHKQLLHEIFRDY